MKIFSQYIDNKFINSLSDINSEYIQTAAGRISNNLYDIHYQYNFDMYIFYANGLTIEINQFIQEYCDDRLMVFYHPKIINEHVLNICDNVKHISHIAHPATIQIPFLVNPNIFYKHRSKEESEKIVCFLDDFHIMPSQLENLLYPKTKQSIKLFTNKFPHKQNFGHLKEFQKALMLNSHKYYLDLDGKYFVEAKLCGSDILTIGEAGDIIPSNQSMPEYTTYQKFIESIAK